MVGWDDVRADSDRETARGAESHERCTQVRAPRFVTVAWATHSPVPAQQRGRRDQETGPPLEDLVAGREDLVRVVLLLGGVQLTEGRAEVVAPLALGHRERADRVKGAAGRLDPPVGGLVG